MTSYEEKTIDGVQFTCARLAPLRGLRMKAKLARALGPMIRAAMPAIRGLEDAKSVADLPIERGADLIAAVSAHLDPDTLPELIAELLATCSAIAPDDRGVLVRTDFVSHGMIDLFFANREATMYKAIWFCGVTQFAGFFGSIRSALPTLTQPPSP